MLTFPIFHKSNEFAKSNMISNSVSKKVGSSRVREQLQSARYNSARGRGLIRKKGGRAKDMPRSAVLTPLLNFDGG